MATRGQDRRAREGAPTDADSPRPIGSSPRLWERVLPTVQHTPLIVTGAVRRFREDPARGRAALERALPRLTPGAPGGDVLAALDRAIAADRYDEAVTLLERLAPGDPARLGAELAVAGLAGRLNDVLAHEPSDRRGRRALRRAAADRQRLSAPLPTWCAVSPRTRPTTAEAPRILHVVTNSLPRVQAGSTIRTQRVARAQRDAGWDAQVVTRPGFPVTRGEAWAADVQYVDGIPYHRLLPRTMPSEARVPEVYARELAALVDGIRPDLLHGASDPVNARAALEVGRRAGLPVAYEARSFFEDTWLSRHGGDPTADTYRLLRDRHTEILRAADVVTTLGVAMRDEIVRRGVPADRVIIAPNAVPAAFLEPRADTAEQARSRLGLENADLWVGSLATLNADEGFDTLLEALALLRAEGVDARALLVGSGPTSADLARQAEQRAVPLTMPGRVPVDAVLPWYDALDVFAFPRHDTALNRLVTGLKPVEAQAREIPVVGSDLPAVREVSAPGAALVASGDAAALAEALSGLLDPRERGERGRAARQWVKETRTWPRVMEAYRAAYSFGGISAA